MVLRMEQGPLLQQQLPIHAEYGGLPITGDCADQCGPAQAQDTYSHHGAVDVLRRDNTLNHHISSSYPFATPQSNASARYVAERPVTESGSYQTTSHLTDSSSGSISTSPSSAASSLAYTNYPGAHYTNIQQFPGAVQLPQSFVSSNFPGARSTSIHDAASQSMLPPPSRSSLSSLTNAADRDSLHATSTPFLARTTLPSAGFASYTNFTETPRSVLQQATAALTLSSAGSQYSAHMASASQQNYGTTPAECANFPWSDVEAVVDMNCDGQLLVPKIHAKVEKGFFPAPQDKRWTCYRRNYFSVTCGFELRPNISNGRITIRRNNDSEQIQAMGMRLSAAVDGVDGKNIELVQHTPKRDAGPKTKIDVCKVAPTVCNNRTEQGMPAHGSYPLGTYHSAGQAPGPYLPLQHLPESDTQAGASQSSSSSSSSSSQYGYASSGQPALLAGQGTTHSFERVQFKQATANNGKRRATQQYFHLIVELFADVRKEGSDKPVWVKVAHRVSEKIVVRGRSPSHYSNEKGESIHATAGRGSINGIGAYSTGGASYGNMNAGGFRVTNAYGSNLNGHHAAYRSRGELQYSDHGSQSDSSGSSLEEGPMDTGFQTDTVMSDADRMALHEHPGYQYFPSAIYENVHAHNDGGVLPPLTKLDSKQYAVKAEYGDAVAGAQYQSNSCGRFQGVDTSRGYFPDIQTRF